MDWWNQEKKRKENEKKKLPKFTLIWTETGCECFSALNIESLEMDSLSKMPGNFVFKLFISTIFARVRGAPVR